MNTCARAAVKKEYNQHARPQAIKVISTQPTAPPLRRYYGVVLYCCVVNYSTHLHI